jgi:antirestriction protein ArdC
MKKDVYQIVNEIVIKGLETKGLQWFKSWKNASGNTEFPINRQTGKAYNGINVFLLNALMLENEYSHNEWMTYKQAEALGGNVIKGSKSAEVFYYHVSFKDTDTNKYYANEQKLREDGKTPQDKNIEKIFALKMYRVFNLAQTEGIEPRTQPSVEPTKSVTPIESAEAIIKGFKDKPIIKNLEQDRAYYSPMQDLIVMPTMAQFNKEDNYYKTLFHEMIHSTGHESRVGRKLEGFHADSNSYSFEELIAEIGSMYLTSIANLDTATDNSQAYINGWIKYLKGERKDIIVRAMTQSKKAVEYIIG